MKMVCTGPIPGDPGHKNLVETLSHGKREECDDRPFCLSCYHGGREGHDQDGRCDNKWMPFCPSCTPKA